MIKFNGENYECEKAVKNGDRLTLYIGGSAVAEFGGVTDFTTFEGKIEDITPSAVELEIAELKARLAETDYIAAKLAEGAATREEYADELAQRAEWRRKINELEGSVDG